MGFWDGSGIGQTICKQPTPHTRQYRKSHKHLITSTIQNKKTSISTIYHHSIIIIIIIIKGIYIAQVRKGHTCALCTLGSY